MSAFTVVTLECDGCGATAQSKLQLAPTLLLMPVEGWLIRSGTTPWSPILAANNISSPLSSHILCPSCAVTEDSVRRLRASAEPPSSFLATGSNLDVLADNLMGLARLPGETDQSLRGRIMKVVGPS